MNLFMVAGEASGDALGASLLDGLIRLGAAPDVRGVAGPAMQRRGAETLFPMDELSVMGIWEVLPRYRALHRRMVEVADAAIHSDARALITIDSPDFCLRVASRVRAARPDLPIIHYVAPSVWAWRPGRAKKMARFVDHVLALLPFEPPLMEDAGMTCDFVGHPAATEVRADPDEVARFRQVNGLERDVLLILPGSRQGEIARLSPTFGVAAALTMRARPHLQAVIPVAPGRMSQVRAVTDPWPFRPLLIDSSDTEARRAAFAVGSVALAASGTVSLNLAREGVPMVVGYDVNPVSRFIMSRMMVTDTVTLVNLVSGTRAIPEFIGSHFKAAPMAAAAVRALAHPEPQKAAMRETMALLGEGDEPPGVRAARSVIAAISRLSA